MTFAKPNSRRRRRWMRDFKSRRHGRLVRKWRNTFPPVPAGLSAQRWIRGFDPRCRVPRRPQMLATYYIWSETNAFNAVPAGLPGKSTLRLCSVCRAFEENCLRPIEVTFANNAEQARFDHYKTWGELNRSANRGCNLCKTLRNGLGPFKDNKPSSDPMGFHFTMKRPERSEEGNDFLRDSWVRFTYGDYYKHEWKRDSTYQDFMIGVDKGNAPLEEAHGRFDARRPSKSPDLNLAVQWLRDCLENHPGCSKIPDLDGDGPTRLIWIEPGAKKVRLVPGSKQYEFVTLTHRWGSTPVPVTRRQNVDERMTLFETDLLPATFRDTMQVVDRLGYQYVWIDCLCIVQDDKREWEVECPKMASIYRHAVLNISAAGSEDSYGGLLSDRLHFNNPKFQTRGLQYRNEQGQPVKSHNLSLWYPGQYRDYIFEDKKGTLLDERGWIVQEKLLSPRILYFGKNTMFFQCSTSTRNELALGARPTERMDYKYYHHHYNSKRKFLQKDLTFEYAADFYYWWEKELLPKYTRCELTHPEDRIPALSGLVRALKPPDGEYLAGIWAYQLPDALCWTLKDDYLYTEDNKPPPRIPGIPTWSWASVSLPCNPYFIEEEATSTLFFVLSSDVVPAGADPYGQVGKGILRICGRLCPLFLAKSPKHDEISGHDYYVWTAPGEAFTGRFTPDDQRGYDFSLPLKDKSGLYEEVERESCHRLVALLLVEVETGHLNWWGPDTSYRGMALEPVEGSSDTYRRVGMIKFDWSEYTRMGFGDTENFHLI